MSTVLVTGGSGFVGSHAIRQLLAEGHEVRTTVRSLERKPALVTLLESDGGARADRVEFFAADLNSDAGWVDAVRGADYVLHIASPFPIAQPKDENELIIPARDGALRVMRAARDAGVKRVVLTSSFAAVAYGHGVTEQQGRVFTEDDWTELDGPGVTPYVKSKTLAERAAWDFVAREGNGLELSVINPTGIFGPVLGGDLSTSVATVRALLSGQITAIPPVWINVIDVRDVADLHIRAMTSSVAAGQRYLGLAGDSMSFAAAAEALRSALGPAGAKIPTRKVSGWVVRAMGAVNPQLREIRPQLTRRPASNAKARRDLNWTPRTNEEAVVATGESLVRLGLV